MSNFSFNDKLKNIGCDNISICFLNLDKYVIDSHKLKKTYYLDYKNIPLICDKYIEEIRSEVDLISYYGRFNVIVDIRQNFTLDTDDNGNYAIVRYTLYKEKITAKIIEGLIKKRNEYKALKNWNEADIIRDYLDNNGIILEDIRSENTIWKKKINS